MNRNDCHIRKDGAENSRKLVFEIFQFFWVVDIHVSSRRPYANASGCFFSVRSKTTLLKAWLSGSIGDFAPRTTGYCKGM